MSGPQVQKHTIIHYYVIYIDAMCLSVLAGGGERAAGAQALLQYIAIYNCILYIIILCLPLLRQEGVSVPQVHKRFFMLHWVMAEACSDCCVGDDN